MLLFSQDLWSGTVTTPSADTWGVYFSGHLIVEAVVDALTQSYGLDVATDVILEGDSAGLCILKLKKTNAVLSPRCACRS